MMKTTENILLTGYRATGKTLIGTMLAVRTGKQFIDTDQEICLRTKSSIHELVARFGWQRFRDEEKKVLQELRNEENVIVAVGGGAIEHQQVWETIRTNYFIVWLQADAETVFQRITQDQKSEQQRPPLTDDSLFNEIQELLNRRDPLYRKGSDFFLDTTTSKPELLVETILTAKKETRNVTA